MVHAPQWPSLHAIFVPVNPSCSRSTSARLAPTGASSTCSLPLTVTRSSGIRRQGEDVGEMDEPRGGARDGARSCLVLRLGQRPPEVACGEQQLADLRKV